MSAVQTIAERRARQWSTSSPAPALARRLKAARERTLLFASAMTGERLLGPKLALVNPPLWEIAHVAWFQEYWCLRYRDGQTAVPASIEHVDALYNSALAAHDTRWELPLLPF